jgi:D-3-phosphoglycerate dehydrogenase
MAGGADLVMIQSVRPLLSDRVIPELTRCRGIIRLGLGYDSVDIAAATDAGIPVSNVVDWCTDEVAEHAIALLFAAARRLTPLNQMVRSGGWERDAAVRIHRISGQTLGIIGFGRVGREVSQRMGAFGLNIIAYHPRQDTEAISRYGARKVALDDLLREADWITLHLPLTEETYHMIGPHELGLMKDGVILVNTARGAVIDESALVEALRSGKIGAAGLDVMEQEPLPAGSALRQFSNVTFTTHVASYSQEAVETLYRFGAEIGADMLSGTWVSTIVNPDVRGKAEARWGAFVDGLGQ